MKKKTPEKCAHHVMCISVLEYGICENEDPDYNDPNHCEYDTRKKLKRSDNKK